LYVWGAYTAVGAEGLTLRPSPQQLEAERSLVEAARSNPVAFGALYERYVDAIYAYAYQRTGNRTMAEDVVSETFHKALENIHGYEWRGVAFSAWLYRIASNVVAARFRREPIMGGEEELESALDLEPGPELSLTILERRTDVMKAVRMLPDDQQQVVLLRFGQDLRNKEIARVMQRSEGAVKLLLHRALAGLHRRLAAVEE
jgi:RNA polymerase sigma-70 factor (ECF subfamily)